MTTMLEHLGQDYDDVLLSCECDEYLIAAMMALPAGARWWDLTFKAWHIHLGYVAWFAADLRILDCKLLDGGDRR
ncbi:hypothetical protein X011_26380 [Mycobacterium tuberculosis variant microti OV254]|nr:hypothetical protein X011_26380 [Mycobacterium tuberculosis variant microti OV254]